MDSSRERRWILVGKPRTDKSSLKQQPNEILDISVTDIAVDLLLQLTNNGMVWIDLHGLLGHHVAGHVVILKSLSLHDSLHVGRPSPLRSNQNTRGVSQSETQLTFFDLVSEDLFEVLAKWLELSLLFLLLFLLVLSLLELESLFGAVSEFLTLILLELLNDILINWVSHVKDLVVSLLE